MTGEQKQQIYLLRKTGTAFGDIAAKLGLPRNTVKTFCWRNGLSDAELAAPQENKGYMGFCKNCGKSLEQKNRSRPKNSVVTNVGLNGGLPTADSSTEKRCSPLCAPTVGRNFPAMPVKSAGIAATPVT
jgi:hypothetical protein